MPTIGYSQVAGKTATIQKLQVPTHDYTAPPQTIQVGVIETAQIIPTGKEIIKPLGIYPHLSATNPDPTQSGIQFAAASANRIIEEHRKQTEALFESEPDKTQHRTPIELKRIRKREGDMHLVMFGGDQESRDIFLENITSLASSPDEIRIQYEGRIQSTLEPISTALESLGANPLDTQYFTIWQKERTGVQQPLDLTEQQIEFASDLISASITPELIKPNETVTIALPNDFYQTLGRKNSIDRLVSQIANKTKIEKSRIIVTPLSTKPNTATTRTVTWITQANTPQQSLKGKEANQVAESQRRMHTEIARRLLQHPEETKIAHEEKFYSAAGAGKTTIITQILARQATLAFLPHLPLLIAQSIETLIRDQTLSTSEKDRITELFQGLRNRPFFIIKNLTEETKSPNTTQQEVDAIIKEYEDLVNDLYDQYKNDQQNPSRRKAVFLLKAILEETTNLPENVRNPAERSRFTRQARGRLAITLHTIAHILPAKNNIVELTTIAQTMQRNLQSLTNPNYIATLSHKINEIITRHYLQPLGQEKEEEFIKRETNEIKKQLSMSIFDLQTKIAAFKILYGTAVLIPNLTAPALPVRPAGMEGELVDSPDTEETIIVAKQTYTTGGLPFRQISTTFTISGANVLANRLEEVFSDLGLPPLYTATTGSIIWNMGRKLSNLQPSVPIISTNPQRQLDITTEKYYNEWIELVATEWADAIKANKIAHDMFDSLKLREEAATESPIKVNNINIVRDAIQNKIAAIARFFLETVTTEWTQAVKNAPAIAKELIELSYWLSGLAKEDFDKIKDLLGVKETTDVGNIYSKQRQAVILAAITTLIKSLENITLTHIITMPLIQNAIEEAKEHISRQKEHISRQAETTGQEEVSAIIRSLDALATERNKKQQEHLQQVSELATGASEATLVSIVSLAKAHETTTFQIIDQLADILYQTDNTNQVRLSRFAEYQTMLSALMHATYTLYINPTHASLLAGNALHMGEWLFSLTEGITSPAAATQTTDLEHPIDRASFENRWGEKRRKNNPPKKLARLIKHAYDRTQSENQTTIPTLETIVAKLAEGFGTILGLKYAQHATPIGAPTTVTAESIHLVRKTSGEYSHYRTPKRVVLITKPEGTVALAQTAAKPNQFVDGIASEIKAKLGRRPTELGLPSLLGAELATIGVLSENLIRNLALQRTETTQSLTDTFQKTITELFRTEVQETLIRSIGAFPYGLREIEVGSGSAPIPTYSILSVFKQTGESGYGYVRAGNDVSFKIPNGRYLVPIYYAYAQNPLAPPNVGTALEVPTIATQHYLSERDTFGRVIKINVNNHIFSSPSHGIIERAIADATHAIDPQSKHPILKKVNATNINQMANTSLPPSELPKYILAPYTYQTGYPLLERRLFLTPQGSKYRQMTITIFPTGGQPLIAGNEILLPNIILYEYGEQFSPPSGIFPYQLHEIRTRIKRKGDVIGIGKTYLDEGQDIDYTGRLIFELIALSNRITGYNIGDRSTLLIIGDPNQRVYDEVQSYNPRSDENAPADVLLPSLRNPESTNPAGSHRAKTPNMMITLGNDAIRNSVFHESFVRPEETAEVKQTDAELNNKRKPYRNLKNQEPTPLAFIPTLGGVSHLITSAQLDKEEDTAFRLKPVEHILAGTAGKPTIPKIVFIITEQLPTPKSDTSAQQGSTPANRMTNPLFELQREYFAETTQKILTDDTIVPRKFKDTEQQGIIPPFITQTAQGVEYVTRTPAAPANNPAAARNDIVFVFIKPPAANTPRAALFKAAKKIIAETLANNSLPALDPSQPQVLELVFATYDPTEEESEISSSTETSILIEEIMKAAHMITNASIAHRSNLNRNAHIRTVLLSESLTYLVEKNITYSIRETYEDSIKTHKDDLIENAVKAETAVTLIQSALASETEIAHIVGSNAIEHVTAGHIGAAVAKIASNEDERQKIIGKIAIVANAEQTKGEQFPVTIIDTSGSTETKQYVSKTRYEELLVAMFLVKTYTKTLISTRYSSVFSFIDPLEQLGDQLLPHAPQYYGYEDAVVRANQSSVMRWQDAMRKFFITYNAPSAEQPTSIIDITPIFDGILESAVANIAAQHVVRKAHERGTNNPTFLSPTSPSAELTARGIPQASATALEAASSTITNAAISHYADEEILPLIEEIASATNLTVLTQVANCQLVPFLRPEAIIRASQQKDRLRSKIGYSYKTRIRATNTRSYMDKNYSKENDPSIAEIDIYEYPIFITDIDKPVGSIDELIDHNNPTKQPPVQRRRIFNPYWAHHLARNIEPERNRLVARNPLIPEETITLPLIIDPQHIGQEEKNSLRELRNAIRNAVTEMINNYRSKYQTNDSYPLKAKKLKETLYTMLDSTNSRDVWKQAIITILITASWFNTQIADLIYETLDNINNNAMREKHIKILSNIVLETFYPDSVFSDTDLETETPTLKAIIRKTLDGDNDAQKEAQSALSKTQDKLQEGMQDDATRRELQNEANDEDIELETTHDIETETSYIALKSRGSSLVLQLWQKNIADGEYELLKLLYKGVNNRKLNDDDSPWARNSVYLAHGSNSLSDQTTFNFRVYNGLLGSHTGHHQPLVSVPYKRSDGTITRRELPATNTPVHVISSMDEYKNAVRILMDKQKDDEDQPSDTRTQIRTKWQTFWNKIKKNPDKHLVPLLDDFDTKRSGNKPLLHRPDPIALILTYAAIKTNTEDLPLLPENEQEYTDLLNAITLLYYAWNEIDYKTLQQHPTSPEHTSLIIAIDRTLLQLQAMQAQPQIMNMLTNLRDDLITTISSQQSEEDADFSEFQQVLNTLAWYSMASDISRQHYIFGFFIRPPILKSSSWMPTPITLGLTFWIEPPSLLFISATQGDNDGDYARIAIAAPLMYADDAYAAEIITKPIDVIERTYTQNLFQSEEPHFNQAPATDAAATHGQIFLTAASNLPFRRNPLSQQNLPFRQAEIPIADLSQETIDTWTIGIDNQRTIPIFHKRKTFVGFEWSTDSGQPNYKPRFFRAETDPFARREISYLSPHEDEWGSIQKALALTKRPPLGFHDTSWLSPQQSQTESPFEYYGTLVGVKRGETTYYTTLAHLTYIIQTIAHLDEIDDTNISETISAIISAAEQIGWLQQNGLNQPEHITPLSRENLTRFYNTLGTHARAAAISALESTKSPFNQPRVYDPEQYIKSAQFPPAPATKPKLSQFATVAKTTPTKLQEIEQRIATTTLDTITISCLHFATALRGVQTKLLKEKSLTAPYTIVELLEDPAKAINADTNTDAHTIFALYYEDLDENIKNQLYEHLSDEDANSLKAYFIPYDAIITIGDKTYEVGVVVDNITDFPYVLMIERDGAGQIIELYTTFTLYTLTHQNPNTQPHTHQDPTAMTIYNPIAHKEQAVQEKSYGTISAIQQATQPIRFKNNDFALQTLHLLIPPSDETLNRPHYNTLGFDPLSWYGDLEYQMTLKPFGFMLNMSYEHALAAHYDMLTELETATAVMISPAVFTVLQMIDPFRTNAANTKRLMNAINKATTLGTEIEYVESGNEKRILIGHAKNNPLHLQRLQTILSAAGSRPNASIRRKRSLTILGSTTLADTIRTRVQHYVGLLSNELRRANYDPQIVSPTADCSQGKPNNYSPAVIPIAHMHTEIDLTQPKIQYPSTLSRAIKQNAELARGMHLHAIDITTEYSIELPENLADVHATRQTIGKWILIRNKLIPKQNLWIIGNLEVSYSAGGFTYGLLYPITITAKEYQKIVQQSGIPAIGYDEELNTLFEKAIKEAIDEVKTLIQVTAAKVAPIAPITIDQTEKEFTFQQASRGHKYPFPIARYKEHGAYPLASEAKSPITITVNKNGRQITIEKESVKDLFVSLYAPGDAAQIALLQLAIASSLMSNPDHLNIIKRILRLPDDHPVVRAFGKNFVYFNKNNTFWGVAATWDAQDNIPTFKGKNIYGQLVTQIGRNLIDNPLETLTQIRTALEQVGLLSHTMQDTDITVQDVIDSLIQQASQPPQLHIMDAAIFARTPVRCLLSRINVYEERGALPIVPIQTSPPLDSDADTGTAGPDRAPIESKLPPYICKMCAGRKSNKMHYNTNEIIEYDRAIAQNMVDAPQAIRNVQTILDEQIVINGQRVTRSTIDPANELQEQSIISIYRSTVQSAFAATVKNARAINRTIAQVRSKLREEQSGAANAAERNEIIKILQEEHVQPLLDRAICIFVPQGHANRSTIHQILEASYFTAGEDERLRNAFATQHGRKTSPHVKITFIVESPDDAMIIESSIREITTRINEGGIRYHTKIRVGPENEFVTIPFGDAVATKILPLREQYQIASQPVDPIYPPTDPVYLEIEEILKTLLKVNPEELKDAGVDIQTAYAMLISNAILYDSISMNPRQFEHARKIAAIARKVGTPILYYEPEGTQHTSKLRGLGEHGNLPQYENPNEELAKTILIIDALAEHGHDKSDSKKAQQIIRKHMIESTRKAIRAALWGQSGLTTIHSMLHLRSALQRYEEYDPRTRTTERIQSESIMEFIIGMPPTAQWVIGHEPRMGEGRTPGYAATLTPPTPRP